VVSIPTFKIGLINEYEYPVLEILILREVMVMEMQPNELNLSFNLGTFICRDLWTGAKHF
jgi:hypothetical protein